MTPHHGVLFICSHNSARSQMAHGWLQHLAGNHFEVHSAGVEPGVLNPLSVKVMAEVGINISDHVAQGVDRYLGKVPIYHLIIVCDKAAQTCPRVWPGAQERHEWLFDDPSAATGTQEDKLKVFRRVRDEIHQQVTSWIAAQKQASTASGDPL